MADVLEIHKKQDYILVTYTGEFNAETAKRAIDESLMACSIYTVCAVLFDCRKMTGRLPVVGRYQVANYGKKMVGVVSKVALVRQQDATPPDLFTEIVARNRGADMKIFVDIDQAIEWLKA